MRRLYKKANIGHKNNMSNEKIEIQDKILLAALADVPFDGWAWAVIEQAGEKAGYDRDMVAEAFPDKIQSILLHFSNWADREMLARLEDVSCEDMRIRDRVRRGVAERLNVLEPYKESVRASGSYWLNPFRKITAGKMVWQSADKIWIWAGDTSTDYNHYTKRALLSGVITSTMLAWFNDHSDNREETLAFLDRRIDNVLKIGKLAGGLIGRVSSLKSGLKNTLSKG